MIPIHSATLALFTELEEMLASSTDEHAIIEQIHASIWSLLSQPSFEFLKKATRDPFTRFLLITHLKDDLGTLAPASNFTHDISRAQWGFRATACKEIMRLADATNETAQK